MAIRRSHACSRCRRRSSPLTSVIQPYAVTTTAVTNTIATVRRQNYDGRVLPSFATGGITRQKKKEHFLQQDLPVPRPEK